MASMNTQTNTVNSVNAKRPSSAKKGLSFTAEQLKQLHWREGLSLTQIGALYGVSCAAIEYWIPRPEILPAEQEETQANTEPIPDRNAGAGVENTKVAQNGRQVGHRSATDDAQPSGRHQPIRCIPTYAETHRAQQKCPAPGRAITFL